MFRPHSFSIVGCYLLRKKSQWEGDKTEEEEADQVEDIQKRRKKMRLNERR